MCSIMEKERERWAENEATFNQLSGRILSHCLSIFSFSFVILILLREQWLILTGLNWPVVQ